MYSVDSTPYGDRARVLGVGAAAGTATPLQRLLREAAVHDPVTSERLLQVGMQVAPTTSPLRPSVIGRAWNIRRRARRTAATQNQLASPAAALAGIGPASSSAEPGLLRVQSVRSFFSAQAIARTRHLRAQPRKSPDQPS